MKITSYPSVGRWLSRVLSRRTRSEGTVRVYLFHLRKFCEWAKKSPDELITEHLKNQESPVEAVRRLHEELVTQYFLFLESTKKLSRNTAILAHATIRSFYKANYAPLKLETPESWPTRHDKIPTRAEVQAMLKAAKTPLEKAILAFSAQSGQRVGVIISLRYHMVKEALADDGPGRIHVPSDLKDAKGHLVNKRRQNYDFFIGEDAKSLLKSYLETRGQLHGDDLVFVNPRRIRGRTVALDDEAVNRMLKTASRTSGQSVATSRTVHHHVLRKYFQTAMEEAGVAANWYNYMMGHVLPKTQQAYSKPSLEQLKSAYARAEPNLGLLSALSPERTFRTEPSLLREQAGMNGTSSAGELKKVFEPLGHSHLTSDHLDAPYATHGGIPQTNASPQVSSSSARLSRNTSKVERRIVPQEELETLLTDGWEPVMEMSNGRVVVRREISVV